MHKFASSCIAAIALDARATLAEVNKILGTDIQEVPAVELVPDLPRHDWGAYADGLVQISRETWAGCEAITLAHEISHYVAVKARLLRDVPTDARLLKAGLERIARQVEDAWPGYAPNCRTPD